jgi:valyl-tRNA synthetase
LLAGLAQVVEAATASFEAYDYTGALDVTESFFWSFCDDYLELVKERAYGAQGEEAAASARAALGIALDALLRLLAPIMPFCTEEVWSWWQEGSIHHAAWPAAADLVRGLAHPGDPALLTDLATALAAVRGAKSAAKVSMKTEVTRAEFAGPAATLDRLRAIEADLRAVGRITGDVTWTETDAPLGVDVDLVPAAG